MAVENRLAEAALPVSVVIPARNAAATIARAVESALTQMPAPPAEIIVVDDGSDDGTSQVAQETGATVVRHEHGGRGVSAARNAAIKRATQPWIATLDADDAWLPHHLDTVLRASGGRVLVSTSALACGPDPAEDRVWGVPGPLPLRTPADVLAPSNPVVLSGALFDRQLALEVGLFPEGVARSEDLDLWVRMLERGQGVALPDVTVLYALHPGQASHDRSAMRDATMAVASAYDARPWWSDDLAGRLDGAATWDDLRAELRSGRRVSGVTSLVGLLASPRRLSGVWGLLSLRRRMRSVGARLDRTGAPSTLLAPDARDAEAWAEARFGPYLRPVGGPLWRQALQMARHPAGRVVTRSPWLKAVGRARAMDVIEPPAEDALR